MSIIVQPESPPLRHESDGSIRIGRTRVLLDIVVRAFQQGATAETIAQQYDTLSLADVYAAISYYLRHRDDVDGYLRERERAAKELRDKIEGKYGDLTEIRQRIAARRSQ